MTLNIIAFYNINKMDEQQVIEKLQALKYSLNSAKQLLNTAKGFKNEHYPNLTFDDLLKRPISNLGKLTRHKNINTKRNIAKALLKIKEALGMPNLQRDVNYYRKVFKANQNARETQERKPIDPTQTEKKIDVLKDRLKDANNDPFILIQVLPSLLLYNLMTKIPTRRATDYRTLLLKKPKHDFKKTNFYTQGKLYFNQYKGSDKKGQVIVDLPEDIKKQFLLLRKIDRNRQYLIEDAERKPMTPSAFSKFVIRTYGMNVNDFRHLYVQQNVDSEAIDNAKLVASGMSNSLTTQQKDYVSRTAGPEREDIRDAKARACGVYESSYRWLWKD